jgi:hypothetical protein
MLKKKTAALAGRPASKSGSQSQHQHDLDSEQAIASKPRTSNYFPADACPAPDDAGEDDFQYFIARPGITTRIRLPFPNEFPGVQPAYVRISIERDAYDLPKRRARRLLCFCEGGTA